MDYSHHRLLPPPVEEPAGEAWPIIEPPLRDQAAPSWTERVERREPFESRRLENVLSLDAAHDIQGLALAHQDVQKLLNGKKYIVIGLSQLDTKADQANAPSLVLVVYNYTDNTTIEVMLDSSRAVTGVVAASYQPAPVQGEIDAAVHLARVAAQSAQYVTDALEGSAIMVSPADADDPIYGHRLFDVRFGRPDERLPMYRALVDLTTETVLVTAPVDAHG